MLIMHPEGWKPYSSPWFQPFTVTAPDNCAAVVILAGATPAVTGPVTPAQTMLLLSEAQAPRVPQLVAAVFGAPAESAYRLPPAQPSCRAPASPIISVLL